MDTIEGDLHCHKCGTYLGHGMESGAARDHMNGYTAIYPGRVRCPICEGQPYDMERAIDTVLKIQSLFNVPFDYESPLTIREQVKAYLISKRLTTEPKEQRHYSPLDTRKEKTGQRTLFD